MHADEWIAVAAAIFTGLGVIAALKGVRDQLRVSTFLAYTERYSALMKELPFDARRPGSGYQLETVSAEEKDLVLRVFRDYLNLCSEELWLASVGRIDAPVWRLWQIGMIEVARFPSFNSAWSVLQVEFTAYNDFVVLMDQIAAKRLPAAPTILERLTGRVSN